MPVDEVHNATWSRKHDEPGTSTAVPSIVYPKNLVELIEICKRVPKTKLKAAGSHWALSRAAMSDHTHIETNDPANSSVVLHPAMDRTIYDVVPARLSDAFTASLARAHQPDFDNEGAWMGGPNAPITASYVHVEAGKRIYQLYAELDLDGNGPLADHVSRLGSVQGEHNNSYGGPWAFRTLGGAGGQTVVGALTTGTHGGDFNGPPIADDVVALHLVVDGGRHYWIEPDQDPDLPQMVDDDRLRELYEVPEYGGDENFDIIRDTDLFNAVLVSVGRFGVIYSVVLRAVRQYCLHEQRRLTTWDQVKDKIRDYASDLYDTQSDVRPNQFLQIAISVTPHLGFSKHLAGVTQRWKTKPEPSADKPNGRAERVGDQIRPPGTPVEGLPTTNSAYSAAGASIAYTPDPDKPNAAKPISFLESACMDGDFLLGIIETVIDEVRTLVEENKVVAGGATAAVVVTGTGAGILALAVPLLALLALLAALLAAKRAAGGGTRQGEVMAEVQDVLLDHDDPALKAAGIFIWQCIAFKVFSDRQADQDYTAISYAVMDQHNYLDVSCEVNVDSIEVFFDASDTQLIAFVDAVLAFESAQEMNGRAFVGYISLRFTGPGRALLAEQRWAMSCAVEIAGLKDSPGVTPLIEYAIALSRDRNYGGILHWGQRNDSNRSDIEHRFGADLQTWRTKLRQLTDDGAADAFSSAFTVQTGLEPR